MSVLRTFDRCLKSPKPWQDQHTKQDGESRVAKFIIECFDERGEALEAHCEHASGDPYNRFRIELLSDRGIRGVFQIDVPDGTPIGRALNERIQMDGIHARN